MKKGTWFTGILFGCVPVLIFFIMWIANQLNKSMDYSDMKLRWVAVFSLLIMMGVILMSCGYMMKYLSGKVQASLSLFWMILLPAIYVLALKGLLNLPGEILNILYDQMNTAFVLFGAYGFALLNGIVKVRNS